MKIALFGGTFDPIHAGHLKAAQAAARRYGLDRVLFIPSGRPPHKTHKPLTDFHHRYAMVTLACARHPIFVPSLLEAPSADGRVNYSLDTVRRARRRLKARDRLYFLIGVDAFLDIRSWRGWRELLKLIHFIVVSRPGFGMESVLEMLPSGLLRGASGPSRHGKEIRLGASTVFLLSGVRQSVSAHQIRNAVRRGRTIPKAVPREVGEYIRKENLYTRKK